MFPTELERHLCSILSLRTFFLDISSTLINSLSTYHSTAKIHPSIGESLQELWQSDSGAHTNTIEGVWALIKKKLKWMCGTLYAFWEASEECHFLIQGFQMHFLKICSTDRFCVALHDLQTLSLRQGFTMTFWAQKEQVRLNCRLERHYSCFALLCFFTHRFMKTYALL